MASAGKSEFPGERRAPAPAQIWLLLPLLVAVCAAVAAGVVPGPARAAVAWCGGAAVLTVAFAAAEAARRGRTIAAQRRRHAAAEAELKQRLVEQEREMRRLSEQVLPTVIQRLQAGAGVEEVLRVVSTGIELHPDFAPVRQRVVRTLVDIIEEEEGRRDTAQRAFVNLARRVQAIVHQQAHDVREMEDRHGNTPDVFHDLLHLDHGNSLVGRLADSIAVLGGSRPGRQWQNPIPLFNVARGAMSRIIHYSRIDIHSVADVGIVGPVVEPLIHALAELLDNATRYSPPHTRVHVTAVEVQSGVAVEIEDAGIGLTDESRARAEEVLERAASVGIDLDDLGESPRLGLNVVGNLARVNNFQVALRDSAYGGVRVVLIVPQDAVCITPVPGGMIARAAKLPPPKPRRRSYPRSDELTDEVETFTGVPTGPPVTPPLSGSQVRLGVPEASESSSPYGEESMEDVPRNANGLPQRRRRALAPERRMRASTPTTPRGGGSGSSGGNGGGKAAPPYGASPNGHGPRASAAVPEPRNGPAIPYGAQGQQDAEGRGEQPVQPGLWLDAFMNGPRTEDAPGPVGGAGSPGGPGTDESY